MALSHLKKVRARVADRYNVSSRPVKFRVGDLVFLWTPAQLAVAAAKTGEAMTRLWLPCCVLPGSYLLVMSHIL
jgi:hypothetical protein